LVSSEIISKHAEKAVVSLTRRSWALFPHWRQRPYWRTAEP